MYACVKRSVDVVGWQFAGQAYVEVRMGQSFLNSHSFAWRESMVDECGISDLSLRNPFKSHRID